MGIDLEKSIDALLHSRLGRLPAKYLAEYEVTTAVWAVKAGESSTHVGDLGQGRIAPRAGSE